jgi:hypothetical protein
MGGFAANPQPADEGETSEHYSGPDFVVFERTQGLAKFQAAGFGSNGLAREKSPNISRKFASRVVPPVSVFLEATLGYCADVPRNGSVHEPERRRNLLAHNPGGFVQGFLLD